VACARCAEGVNFDRFVERGGKKLCVACAEEAAAYYKPLS
jgi:formylmethanofuran dehydrogenase subunit E